VSIALCAPASAQDDWRGWPTAERWRIAAGYFLPQLDTAIQVTDAEGNIGTRISFEQNLGLDANKGTAILTVDWRFFKRHRLSYAYFELNRSAISDDSSVSIIIGYNVFDVNLPIQSFFDITAMELAYSYSVLFNERADLYLGIGISVQDIAAGLKGTASSPDPGAILDTNLDTTPPLPTLNLGFNYAFNDKWIFESKLGWLAVEAELGDDEILDGQIINAFAGVRWKAFQNAGFFATYQLFDVDADFRERGAKWTVDYDYKGPLIGVDVSF
jgi:hypothetical protein